MTIKDKTVSGVTWSFIDNYSNYFIQFVIGIILARLLLPKDFGLIGMLTVFLAISQSFVVSGFSQALIRKQDATQDDKVIWSSVSGYFPFRYIKWGQKVNSYSDVFVYNRGEVITEEPHEIMSNAWFQNDFNFVPEVWLTEQNLVMPNYGMVLTVVWEGKNNHEI